MKRCLLVLAAMVIALGLSVPAQASMISLTPSTPACNGMNTPCLLLFVSGSSQDDVNDAVEEALGIPSLEALLLYKATQEPASEEGPFAFSYETSWDGSPDAYAKIYLSQPPPIAANPVYALIKDGNLGSYFFDVSGWNGTDEIVFSDFYGGNQGKISHVSLYGNLQTVPDGGSMAMLLGMALMGLAGVRRMMK